MVSEIRGELRELISGRVGIADGILPPLLFVLINNIWGVGPAAIAGLGSAVAITGWRLSRGNPIRFAIAGLFGTLLAAILALRSGEAEDFFLPGIISGALTTAALVISIPAKRPLVAFTSWLTRGWPLDWYWHDRVRPAYSRTTIIWALFFGARTFVQWRLFVDEEVEWLGVVRVALGWPALLLLLVATYWLGRRWIEALEGPSVEEFEAGAPPPWEGQKHGF